MKNVLLVYDIAKNLKIPNPSRKLRRYGVRINLSAWVFPDNNVPTNYLEELKSKGVVMHLIDFAPESNEKILELAKEEISKHSSKVMKYVQERIDKLKLVIKDTEEGWSLSEESRKDNLKKHYGRWRQIINFARNEMITAEQCSVCFGITQEVGDMQEALKLIVAAELNAALAFKSKHFSKEMVPA